MTHSAENSTDLDLYGGTLYQQHIHELVSQLFVIIDHRGKRISSGYDVAETKADLFSNFFELAEEQIH